MSKKIKDFGDYTITESGEIYNKNKKRVKGFEKTGGLAATLTQGKNKKQVYFKKIVYSHFIDSNYNNEKLINLDGDVRNNHYKNISLYKYKHERFSKSEESDIINLYKKGKSILHLAKKYKTKQVTISKILHKHDLHIAPKNQYRCSYKLNHDYFKEINSSSKAYLLGFLYADGGINKKTNGIILTINDKEVLDFFAEEIEINKEIYKNPNHEKATTLYFSSRDMKRDLIKLGCGPKKSLSLKFPSNSQVPEKLLPDFIRGYFDGDGSIYINDGKKNLCVKIISSTSFITDLKIFLKGVGITCGEVSRDKKYKQETGYIRITGKKELKKFEKLLYSNDKAFSLKRKKEKFKQI